METGSAVIIFIFLIGICYLIYDSIPSKYTKLEKSFGGFMNRSLVRFEYEKSPLHTIVYGVTGTGKTYFIRQYLKLNSVQNQDLRTDEVRGKPSSLVNHEQSSFTDQNQNRDQNQNQDQNQHQAKNIVIVCKNDRDWIDPESNKFYTGFNKCDISMIIKIICIKFKIV